MESNKRKNKSIKVNAALNVTKQLCKVIFPMVTLPYVTHVLQTSGHGKYNFGSSIVSYFILLAGLEISDYVIREGASDDKVRFQKFSEEVFTINVLSTIVFYAVLFALSFVSVTVWFGFVVYEKNPIMRLQYAADYKFCFY